VARRGSAAFWLGVAQALLKRGSLAGARRCLAQARGLPHPEPAWIDLTEADVAQAEGAHDDARALALRWADDPAFGGPARERLSKIPLPRRPLWRRVAGALRRLVRRLVA
jgi:hypothetical protein